MEKLERKIDVGKQFTKSEIEIINRGLDALIDSIINRDSEIIDEIHEAEFYGHPERIPKLQIEKDSNAKLYSEVIILKDKIGEEIWYGHLHSKMG